MFLLVCVYLSEHSGRKRLFTNHFIESIIQRQDVQFCLLFFYPFPGV